jgi:putative transposon-encoded protein
MVIDKFSLQRAALVVLSLELLTTASFPMLARSQSLNQEELARWEVSTPPTHFPRSEGEISSILQARAIRFPNVGRPRRLISGGVRGETAKVPDSCGNSTSEQVVALLPPTEPVLTVAEYPTIFVSLPRTSAKEAEFILKEADKDEVLYKTTVTLPSNSGIVSVSLPANGTLPPLEVGKDYHWYFFVICNSQDQADEPFVDGQIQRVKPSPNLVAELKNAPPRDRAALYAEAGVWYDAINSIAQLRRSSPNNGAIAADWAELLKSVGLDTISQKPLIP